MQWWQLVYLLVCLFVPGLTIRAQAESLHVVEGQISLGNVSVDDDVALYGNWMFFPNRLISPNEFLEEIRKNNGVHSGLFTEVGKSFVDSSPADFKDNFGKATYVIRLDELRYYDIGMWGARNYTASKIFFFDEEGHGSLKPISENGQLSDDPNRSVPAIMMPDLVPIQARPSSHHYVLIQVANQFHSWGGLWAPPRIARFDVALEKSQSVLRMNHWIIGFCLFIFLYNISLFLRQKHDHGSLYLAIGCLILMIRTFALNNIGRDWLGNPFWSHELSFKFIYLSYTLGIVMIMGFFHSMFPDSCPKPLLNFTIFSQVPLYLAIILFSVRDYYQYISLSLNASVIILTPLFFAISTRAYFNKEKGAIWSFIGSLILVATIGNDILESLGYTQLIQNLTGVGLSAFMALQTQVIADRFSIAFKTSVLLRENLQDEVDKQTREIKTILNTIQQGIFIVRDENLRIGKTHSYYLQSLCGQLDIHSATLDTILLDRSSLDEDSKARIKSTLFASIKAEPIVFQVNRDNLPWEIKYKSPEGHEKVLELEWTPIADKDGLIWQILVSARDVTELRKYQSKSIEKDQESRIIIEIAQIPEVTFSRFIKIIRAYVDESISTLKTLKAWDQEVIRKIFINIHTVKGLARSIGLHSLSNVSHQVEQELHQQQDGSHWNSTQIILDSEIMLASVDEYQHIAENKLGWNLSEHIIKIPAKKLEHITKSLLSLRIESVQAQHLTLLDEVCEELLKTSFQSMSQLIQEAFSGVKAIARDLEKRPPILEILGSDIYLTSEGLILCHSILTHLLRNSIDHGIEKPEERIRKHKSEIGLIRVELRVNHNNLIIHYQDDGRGLDLKKIKQRAQAMNLWDATRHYSNQEIARFILSSGLSTKDQVSDISGRGLGMDAVQTLLSEAGGNIGIEVSDLSDDADFRPCSFMLSLPKKYWLIYGAVHTKPSAYLSQA